MYCGELVGDFLVPLKTNDGTILPSFSRKDFLTQDKDMMGGKKRKTSEGKEK